MNRIVKLALLLPGPEDVELLDEDLLVSNIKANVIRHQDSKAISKFEKLSEAIRYFPCNYLQNPNLLKLPDPQNTQEAVANINIVESITSVIKTAKLLEQISQADYETITARCLLRRRLDNYTRVLV